MQPNRSVISLDVGEKRIGVAVAHDGIKIAVPHSTIDVDEQVVDAILRIVEQEKADLIVVGLPRNQSGEATLQTAFVRDFAAKFDNTVKVVFQDESLTSVHAEKILESRGRSYIKADIDSLAASLILQDYLESH